MRYSIPVLERLTEKFEQLPGIGHKSAQRLAFYVLGMEEGAVRDFASVLIEAKEKIVRCEICHNISDSVRCKICASPERNARMICVVEDPAAVAAMERTGEFKGMYHVLGGVISPIEGKGPDELSIKPLLKRVKDNLPDEVILATNPNIEGETTAMYIGKLLKPLGILTTRIAYGVPVGGEIEYADEVTLVRALEGRKEF